MFSLSRWFGWLFMVCQGICVVSMTVSTTLAQNHLDTVSAARHAQVVLQEADERFTTSQNQLAAALDAAIERIPQNPFESNFSNEHEVLLRYQEFVDELLEKVEPVLSAQKGYLAIGRKYEMDLAKSAPSFLDLAAKFKDLSASEPYLDYQQDYLTMAEIMELLALRCEHMPNELVPQLAAVEELLPYLLGGQKVLHNFRDVLGVIPILKSGKEFNALDKKLRSYVQSYTLFRQSLHQLHKQLDGQESGPIINLNEVVTQRSQSLNSGKTVTSLIQPVRQLHDSRAVRLSYLPPSATGSLKTSPVHSTRVQLVSVSESNNSPQELDHMIAFFLPGSGDRSSACRVVGVPVQVGTIVPVRGYPGCAAIRITDAYTQAPYNNGHHWIAEPTEMAPTISIRHVHFIR